MKPKRSYSGEISYIGGGIKDDVHIHIGDTIEIETSTNDELLIMNKSAFICVRNVDIVKSLKEILHL